MASRAMTVYRNCEPVINTEYERETEQSPSVAIVEAVATAAGVAPAELPPLFDFVDPDAIDALFKEDTGKREVEQLLSFKMDTWNVFVRADGKIRVCDGTRQLSAPEPVFGNEV